MDTGLSHEVLQRTRATGFKAVVLTIDAIGQGSSDEYVRLGRARPWLPYGNFPTGAANAFKDAFHKHRVAHIAYGSRHGDGHARNGFAPQRCR